MPSDQSTSKGTEEPEVSARKADESKEKTLDTQGAKSVTAEWSWGAFMFDAPFLIAI